MVVSYISYLTPLIITGITGLTLTSIAFDRINKSIRDSVENFKSVSKLGLSAAPMSQLDEEKNDKLRKFGKYEIIVIFLFCLSEIFVIPSFGNALFFDFLNNLFLQNGSSLTLIVFSYIVIMIGFLISVYVYGCAIYFNIKALPPPLYEENDDRKKSRESIPRSA